MTSAVLVTGAASGVGRSTAALFHARGLRVIATDVDAAGLARADAHHTIVADLARPDDVARLVAEASRVLADERLELVGLALVAGIGWTAPSLLADDALVRKTLEVNALAPYALIRGLYPALERARGRVVIVSSVAGAIAQAWCGAYSMSKAAVESLCDCLRFELDAAGSPVTVTSLLPGLIDTPILDHNPAGDEAQWAATPYLPAMRRFQAMISRVRATGALRPEQVAARIVAHVTSTRRPPPREFVVLSGAGVLRLAAALPDGLRDWFRRKMLDWSGRG